MSKQILSSPNGDGRDDSDDETVGSSIGSGVGPGGWRKRLVRLAEEHEEKARAIRLTLAMMADTAKATKQTGHAKILAKALAVEAAGAKRLQLSKGEPSKVRGSGSIALLKQRQRSAKFLARFSTVEPRKITTAKMGVLVRRGYLVKQGDGYLRTEKPYLVKP
jgi:hypothetical protein